MRLEKIVPSARYSDRLTLLFDDGSSLRCGAGELLEFGLSRGTELDEEKFGRLKDACEYYRVRMKAAELTAMKAMSAGELKRKLREKGASEENAGRASERLRELGAIDEEEYARMIVRRCAAKGYGRARITAELRRHMLPAEYWDGALAELPESGDKLDAFIRERLSGKKPDMREKKRVSDALARRGYGWEEISSAMRRYEETAEYPEEDR